MGTYFFPTVILQKASFRLSHLSFDLPAPFWPPQAHLQELGKRLDESAPKAPKAAENEEGAGVEGAADFRASSLIPGASRAKGGGS